VAQNLEIISKTFSANQNSAHGIYDEYQVIDDTSHENPGTPGNILKVFRNNLKILCHPICNWLNLCLCGQTYREPIDDRFVKTVLTICKIQAVCCSLGGEDCVFHRCRLSCRISSLTYD